MPCVTLSSYSNTSFLTFPKFNDAYYICTIITASACANIPTAAPERAELLPTDDQSHQTDEDTQIIKQAREEVERYRNMDRLIPSPHNVVTIAALEVCSAS